MATIGDIHAFLDRVATNNCHVLLTGTLVSDFRLVRRTNRNRLRFLGEGAKAGCELVMATRDSRWGLIMWSSYYNEVTRQWTHPFPDTSAWTNFCDALEAAVKEASDQVDQD